MPTWPASSSEIKFTYSGADEPTNPSEGESWFDTDAADGEEAKVYTGQSWRGMTTTEHAQLGGIAGDNHHTYPVPTAGLAADSVTTAKVASDAVTNALIAADAVDTAQLATDAVDTSEIAADAVTNALIANGAVDTAQIATNAVGANELSIDPATQTELNSHAGAANAHHTPPSTTQTSGRSGGETTIGTDYYVGQSVTVDKICTQVIVTAHYQSQTSIDWNVIITFGSGETRTKSYSVDGTKTSSEIYTIPADSRLVQSVEFTGDSGADVSGVDLTVNELSVPEHSHSI